MRRLLLGLILLASAAFSQTISNVTVDNLTYSQVRILWNTEANYGNDWVQWGTSSGVYPNRTVRSATSTSYINHSVTFAVPAATTIYYVVCSNNGASCSSEGTFTTLAEPATEADEPISFTPYFMPDMPTVWDKVYTVDMANCNANSTGTDTGGFQYLLDQARASTLADNKNILIKVPSGTCDLGTTTFKLTPKVRTGGTTPAIWIVAAAWIDAPNTVPPDGVMVNDKWPDSIFPTIIVSANASQAVSYPTNSASYVTKYYWRGLRFERAVPASAYKTITAATNTSPIQITVTGHGTTTGTYAQIWDCVGNTAANSWHVKLTVIDADTLSLDGTTGNGALVGTCSIAIGQPAATYDTYSLVSLDDSSAAGSTYPTDLRIRDNGFDQIKIMGPTHKFAAAPGSNFNGVQDIEIKNSYVKGLYRWHHTGMTIGSNKTGSAIDITGCKNCTIRNNYVNWPGISIFGQTNQFGLSQHHYIVRNRMEWDDEWRLTSSTSNGLSGFVRQQMEWKSADGLVVKGNVIKNSWVSNNQTGVLGGSTIVLSPRPTDSPSTPLFASASVIRDATISYNWIHKSAGCIYAHGANLENDATDLRGVQRVLIEHNLCSDIDAREYGQVEGSAVQGIGFYLGESGSDFIVRRNTLIDVKGSNAALVRWYNARARRYVIEDNLFAGVNVGATWQWASSAITNVLPAFVDTTNAGDSKTRMLDAFNVTGAPGTVYWRNNLIIPGVTDGVSYNTVGGITKATCDAQFPGTNTVCLGAPAGGDTPNQRYAMLKLPKFDGFDKDKIRSYIPRYDSPVKSGYTGTSFCASNPTLCLRAKDYTDLGADIEGIIRETGMVENVRVYNVGTTTATIGYNRPDSFACTVEYNTNDVWGSQTGGARILDSSGTNLNRNVSLTGLTTGTTYYVHILCASEQPTLTFTTR